MREIRELLRSEPRARVFFAALTQSSLGTGAGYVALLIIALDRFDSPWAISLVLIADLVPSMLLGPLFGAAADRWSRRTCTVVADVLRAVAFVGIALVNSFEVTVAFALLAGTGTGLFTPAALSSLPSLVARRRLAAATSLYGAIADVGYTLGPAVAAVGLLLGGAESLVLANGITFLASALSLWRLDFGPRASGSESREPSATQRPSLLAEARAGLRAVAGMAGVRTVLIASAAALFFGGLFNVGELLFATRDLDTSGSGYSVLVSVFGLGFVAGSISGSGGGGLPELKRRYLTGLLLMGAGFLCAGLSPTFPAAVAAFGLGGFGNGMVLVYERLLIQTVIPDGVSGRIFGVKDTLTAWAFGLAFLSAGALIATIGSRGLLVGAGAGALLAWAGSALALRAVWRAPAFARPRAHGAGRDGGALGPR